MSKLLSAAERKQGAQTTSHTVVRSSEYQQELDTAGINRGDASRFREAEHIPAAEYGGARKSWATGNW
jgi:hypothetical protein